MTDIFEPVEVIEGDSPVILGLPHTGTYVPPDIADDLNSRGRELSDTDWHVHRLYAGVLPEATVVRARFHRYVVDANRDPSGQSLYPGQNTTGLVPLTDFDGTPIWTKRPSAASIEARASGFHSPYHAALKTQVDRVKAKFGTAILFDCHSIRSKIPFLFEGKLPDFNIGTNCGSTCAPEVEAAVLTRCQAAQGYTSVLNGRFKGGWTTRHYGRPDEGIHAIQMELAQSTHLSDEFAGWHYNATKAEKLRVHLKHILQDLLKIASSEALRPKGSCNE